MDKFTFTTEMSESAKQWKERTYAQLIQNKHIKQWLKDNRQEQEFIYRHFGRLSEWLNAVERCEQCK